MPAPTRFFSKGPSTRPGPVRSEVVVGDFAPAVAARLDVPLAKPCGRSLLDALGG